MQVTCPNCGARYAVDPLAIGPTGRTVQCARCSHRWFEQINPVPAASPAPPSPQPVPDFVIRPQPHYTAGLPAIATPRPKVHWGRWVTAAVVLALMVGVAAFAYRNEIRNSLPTEWRAILSFETARALFAPPANPVPPAAARPVRLEIDLANSKVELVDGRYVVRGELLNPGRAPASTTTLKLVFRKGEDVLGERVYSVVEGPVAPGGRLSFSWPLDDPPDGTTNIVPTVE